MAELRDQSAAAVKKVMLRNDPSLVAPDEFNRQRMFDLCARTRILSQRAILLQDDTLKRRAEIDRLSDALKEGIRKAENASYLEAQSKNADYKALVSEQPLDPHSARLLTHIHGLSRKIDQSIEQIELHEKDLWEQINLKQQQ